VLNSSIGKVQSKRAWNLISKYLRPRRKSNIPKEDLADHFRSAFTIRDCSSEGLPENRKALSVPLNVDPFTEEEVLETLGSLPKYKTPGPDKIPNEILRSSRSAIIPKLTLLFNAILAQGHIPEKMN